MFAFIRSKRFVRLLLWGFITLATLVVLLYVWTNWSGKRRWASTKAMIERDGETLDFRKLLPMTPPDAQNLLSIEPLRWIATVNEHEQGHGGPQGRRDDLEKMKWKGGTPPATSGVSLGKATDIQEWVKYLREVKYLELPAGSAATGRDVLTALDAKFPLLKQIADETANRPLAMFTPGLRERKMPDMLFAMPLPHFNAIQSLAKPLALRARAAVAAGESAEAARSIVAIHRLAMACEQEPLLIGFLVGSSLEMMALETLWVGLQDRVFAEDDLRLLQGVYAAEQTRDVLLLAMRGELASGLNAVEFMQHAASGQKEVDPALLSAFSNHANPRNVFLWRAIPSGLFDHWKSVVVELELKHLIQPLKTGGLAESVRAGDAVVEELAKNFDVLRHPDHIVARLILPSVALVSRNALSLDARRQQALAALALERFFVKHARYPATLAELTPEFLPAVPRDPSDGKPLRYRPTPAGRYQLWSVAFDGKDDDGKVTVDSKGKTKLSKRDYLGDWNWQYEPVK